MMSAFPTTDEFISSIFLNPAADKSSKCLKDWLNAVNKLASIVKSATAALPRSSATLVI